MALGVIDPKTNIEKRKKTQKHIGVMTEKWRIKCHPGGLNLKYIHIRATRLTGKPAPVKGIDWGHCGGIWEAVAQEVEAKGWRDSVEKELGSHGEEACAPTRVFPGAGLLNPLMCLLI